MNNDQKKCPVTHLTTDFGAPVVDNQNSMTAGARGPLLAQDLWLNEKLANFASFHRCTVECQTGLCLKL